MKRITTLILTAVLLVGSLMPFSASAASASQQAGIVATVSDGLNVRSSASVNASVKTILNKGSYITLISKSGSWWYVEYASGKFGYCHSDYIRVTPSSIATVATKTTELNIRSGAGIGYSIVGFAKKGSSLIVLSSSGGWSRILYNGTKTGYVSTQYLSTATAGYSTVSLSVPNFKQTDSRWANTLIGSSGKTMAKIGCATTAIAMMESYRTGSVIYPDVMAGKLRYTPTGSVYWPTNYTVVTSSANYLNTIYEQLKQGKPVLFGARNHYGTQHWVVITGFTGGNSLTASDFTINDPGSNTRTTLQQFLNAYPTFYKFFYY